MGAKTDIVKGRIKEAAGALTGNDKLREEGKTDQAVGKAKQAVQNAADTVKKAVKKWSGNPARQRYSDVHRSGVKTTTLHAEPVAVGV